MFGKKVKLFVADAKYRGTGQWGPRPAVDMYGTELEKRIAPDGVSDDPKQPLTYNWTDGELQAKYSPLASDGTAETNTNRLLGASWYSGQIARDINISGVGSLDIPNLYELIVIYLEADNIDALDPSVSSYQGIGHLHGGRFQLSTNSSWSSTPPTRWSSASSRPSRASTPR